MLILILELTDLNKKCTEKLCLDFITLDLWNSEKSKNIYDDKTRLELLCRNVFQRKSFQKQQICRCGWLNIELTSLYIWVNWKKNHSARKQRLQKYRANAGYKHSLKFGVLFFNTHPRDVLAQFHFNTYTKPRISTRSSLAKFAFSRPMKFAACIKSFCLVKTWAKGRSLLSKTVQKNTTNRKSNIHYNCANIKHSINWISSTR